MTKNVYQHKEIKGFGEYFVTQDGEVYSEKSKKYLRPLLSNGYHSVVLSGATKKRIGIHVLVAEAFISPRPDNLVINHKNGCRTDNRLGNLEWVTQSYNVQHAYDAGLRKINKEHRDRCAELGKKKRSFTENQAKEIKALSSGKRGEIISLSKIFGLSRYAVADILSR